LSAAAVSLAFFDPARRLHGTARAGATVIFDGGAPPALDDGPDISEVEDSYSAQLRDRLSLVFSPISEVAMLGGERCRVCRVSGTVGDAALECLGTATETVEPPAWAELDAVRSVSAILDSSHAVLAVARRPRGAPGHGHELTSAALLSEGDLLAVEDTRLSTVYDADGRQRSAGLELWLPGEDFPRRASGEAVAGTTLELPGLQVNTSVFTWRMDGREGAGAYDVTIRAERPAAA
jgi:hypothetical protein